MRIGLTRFEHNNLYQSVSCSITRNYLRSRPRFVSRPSKLHHHVLVRPFSVSAHHEFTASQQWCTPSIISSKEADGRLKPANPDPPPESGSSKNGRHDFGEIDQWLYLLDKFLPRHLRWSQVDVEYAGNQNINDIFRILAGARVSTGADLLTYMTTKQFRHDAVLYLIDISLKDTAKRVADKRVVEVPTNIQWPEGSLDELCQKPIQVSGFSRDGGRPLFGWMDDRLDRRYSTRLPQSNVRRMDLIWLSLGNMVIEAANSPTKESQAIMSVVHRIMAQLHNQNLVPDNVYSSTTTSYSSTIQRPPILPLMSSRILTMMSDAVWRSQQDDSILLALESGMSYKDMTRNPPGGRFLLRVRDPGFEIWLELILWCCVDGGYGLAACNIIRSLQRQSGEPWFALHWTGPVKSQLVAEAIAWNRMRDRPRGTSSSLIEGYSGEVPLVKMPHRTISAEVVLAVVESLMNRLVWEETDTHQSVGLYINTIQKDIVDAVAFLEPHSLSDQYFDFLTVRLLETGAIHLDKQPDLLHSWTKTMQHVRNLEPAIPKHTPKAGYGYDRILSRTELQPALLHNCLKGYNISNDIGQSLQVFAETQQIVDSRKLQAIQAFLSNSLSSGEQSSNSQEQVKNVDFDDSHGQVPLYKMASFLNFATDNDLIKLGQWLVYTDDVDGPKIPRNSYSQPCLTSALLRFAGASKDKFLLDEVLKAQQSLRLKPSVSSLHTLVNVCIDQHEFDQARNALEQLNNSKLAGYHSQNVAKLASTILRIESEAVNSQAQSNDLTQATDLIVDIFNGHYDPRHGGSRDYLKFVMGRLLRIFESIGSDSLNSLVSDFARQYPVTGIISFPAPVFNTLLAAVVSVKGARQGMQMWKAFCRVPQLKSDGSKSRKPIFVLDQNSTSDDGLDSELKEVIEGQSDGGSSLRLPESQSQPPVATDISLEGSNNFGEKFLPANFVSTTKFSPYEREPHSGVTVVPNIQTLSIIVRQALKEKQEKVSEGTGIEAADSHSPDSIIEWAKPLYSALGASKRVAEQELRQAVLQQDNDPAMPLVASRRYKQWIERQRNEEIQPKYDSKLGYAIKIRKIINDPAKRPRRYVSGS